MTTRYTHDGSESTNDSTKRSIDDVSRRTMLKATGGAALTAGLASTIIGSVSAVGIPTPRLQRDGNQLVDPSGNQVILRGVNMADPARCARSWRGKDAMGVFEKATNTDESNDGGWHNHIIRVPTQPQDIADVGSGGVGSMPHGDDWGPLLPGQFDESDLESYFSSYVDPLVDAAEENGTYMMIDYHRHFPIFHQPQNEEDIGEYECGNESFENDLGFCGERGVLWHSEDQASQLDGYTEEYAAELDDELRLYWNFVAPRYAEREHVIYDIFNEPTGPYAGDWGSPTELPSTGETGEGNPSYDADENQQYWDMWVERAQPWIDIVEENAPASVKTIGSPRWSQLTYWAPTNEFDGDNICYTGHVYTHDGLRPLSDSYGTPAEEVPLFFSEFGWAEGGGRDGFSFLEGTTSEYGDEFASFIDEYPVHPICWNFDHTWEPSFFVHDESQDGNWVIHDYEARPGQWWQEFLEARQDQDLPGGDGEETPTDPTPTDPTPTDPTPTDPPTDTPTDTPTESPSDDLIASIDPGTTSASTGDLVQFWITDETGSSTWITDLQWDLGNGSSGTGWYADQRYQSSGSYTVTLTATDNNGDTSTDSVTVEIS